MKRIISFIFLGAVSLSLWAWENHDWLTGYDWYLEMNDGGPYIYWHNTPYGKFRKFVIPRESTIYRRRLRKEIFYYLYQTEKDKIFYLGISTDQEGKDDEYDVIERGNYSYMAISKGYMLMGSGNRNGGQYDAKHPLVGIWGSLPSLSEIRLVEPADYVYYLEIMKIPGFAIREGTYLFRQTGNNVFETDSCFPDGHMRLTIKNRELLVLTPLFKLPGEKGMVEPLHMRRIPRGSR